MSRVEGVVLLRNIIAFSRMLRRAGLTVDVQQTQIFARVITTLGVDRRRDVRAAGRTIFARSREQRSIYDAAFDLFWRRSTALGDTSSKLPRIRQREDKHVDVEFSEDTPRPFLISNVQSDLPPIGASNREHLRTADFATLGPAEVRDAEAMIAALRPALPMRPARRPKLNRTGQRLAMRAMVRDSLGFGGEVVTWRWLQRRQRPRPIVLVCDISGSMEPYTRFMLRFAHALSRSGSLVEVFVFSTRLTRVTRELRGQHADTALRRVSARVVDWSGGTRIGASIKTLNRRWVRRAIRSGAIVLIVSDGWERGDPNVLRREMMTLQRSCHRLIWLDPLASRPGFAPATVGLRAALPSVDEFLPCADVASLEALAGRLSSLSRRRALTGRASARGVRHSTSRDLHTRRQLHR
jgi:uncharacterized protein